MKSIYISCSCKSSPHTLHLKYFSNEKDFLYIETHLTKFKFLKRLWVGIKYIFGKQSEYGCFDEVMLATQQVEDLKNLCNEFLN